jgi:hypothetical protein
MVAGVGVTLSALGTGAEVAIVDLIVGDWHVSPPYVEAL